MDDEWGGRKVVVEKRGLRVGSWVRYHGGGAVLDRDVSWGNTGFRLKVLVFDGRASAERFGNKFKYPVDVGNCDGFYFDCCEVRRVVKVDPVYWGVMCLRVDRLSLGLVAHEAVHAAFGYCRRSRWKARWPGLDVSVEEHIAYPVDHIVSGVVKIIGEGNFVLAR